MEQKQNFLALKVITNPSTGTSRFKDLKLLIHNVTAKITTQFIMVLMLCMNLSCIFNLIKSIEEMINEVKILAVTVYTCLCKINYKSQLNHFM